MRVRAALVGFDLVAIASSVHDGSLDGQRFPAITQRDGGAGTAGRIIVVENWFEQPRRLVPRH